MGMVKEQGHIVSPESKWTENTNPDLGNLIMES